MITISNDIQLVAIWSVRSIVEKTISTYVSETVTHRVFIASGVASLTI